MKSGGRAGFAGGFALGVFFIESLLSRKGAGFSGGRPLFIFVQVRRRVLTFRSAEGNQPLLGGVADDLYEGRSKNMEVKNVSPDSLVPYVKNAKVHPPEQIEHIANSIKRFGWQQPIVVDRDNVVIIGHGRLAAAKELKLDQVPVVYADQLSEEDVKALRLADKKTNESGWNDSLLSEELAALDIAGIDMSQFGFADPDELSEVSENPYTKAVNIPQYEPTGEDVSISQLVNREKTDELIDEIENSSLPDEEKTFLRMAAQRHLAFNYKKIAEYYAEASEEMQELMEKSALVIIDYNDAIAYGYTRLNDSVMEMFENVEE